GTSPCQPCDGDNSFVKNGACQTCQPWQRLAWSWSRGSYCEDICPNGTIVDPNAPGARTAKAGQRSRGPFTLAPGPGAGKDAPPGGTVVPPPPPVPPGTGKGTPPGTLSATPHLPPLCVPCGLNAYSADNRCYDCGTSGVANTAARLCAPCEKGQVAKVIHGGLTCAADC